MAMVDHKTVVEEFIKWLGTKELSICNCSNLGRVGPPTFWPVDTSKLAERFVNG